MNKNKYVVVHKDGQLPTPVRSGRPDPKGKPDSNSEIVIRWAAGVDIVGGWPTDEAIREATARVSE